MLDILRIEIEESYIVTFHYLSFIFAELSVLVSLWLDWAFFRRVKDVMQNVSI